MFTLAIYCYLIQMKTFRRKGGSFSSFAAARKFRIGSLSTSFSNCPRNLLVEVTSAWHQISSEDQNSSDFFYCSLTSCWRFPFPLQKKLLLVDSLGLDVLMIYAFPCRISRPARCTPDIPLGDLRMGNCIQWFQSSSCSKNAR